jgi:hypothetical protein
MRSMHIYYMSPYAWCERKKKRQCPATTLDSIQSLAIGTAAWAEKGGKTAVQRPPCIFCPETDRLDRAMRLLRARIVTVPLSGQVMPYTVGWVTVNSRIPSHAVPVLAFWRPRTRFIKEALYNNNYIYIYIYCLQLYEK